MDAHDSNKRLQEARNLLANYNCAEALPAYQKLVRHFPNRSDVWLEYGSAARGMNQLDLADQAWRKAAESDPHNSELLVKIGHQYRDLRQPDAARAWYEKAVAVDPKGSHPRMAMAILLERDSRFAEARESVEACLAVDSKNEEALYFAALLDRRENKTEAAERRLRDLIASDPQHQFVRYACRYELAEVLNRVGRFDAAMEMLVEAKSLVRRLANINIMLNQYEQATEPNRALTQKLPKDILRVWAREFPASTRKSIPNLALLGGHPRSGTTLLEQILGAHPGVAAFDEPRAFKGVVCQLYHSSPQVTGPRLNVMRRRYFEALESEGDGKLNGKVVVDKNPAPTSDLRIWLRVFPELRVLIALRDPRDVVVSCFFQNMLLNIYNANYLTLERTAKRYGDLMDIWLAVREWDGLNWLETRYEDTVADLGKEGRRVNGFLGLEWDEGQARFHEKSNKRINSPTYHDASQPIYTRSVARWRAYEKHLAPILPKLEPYCRALGYS